MLGEGGSCENPVAQTAAAAVAALDFAAVAAAADVVAAAAVDVAAAAVDVAAAAVVFASAFFASAVVRQRESKKVSPFQHHLPTVDSVEVCRTIPPSFAIFSTPLSRHSI